MPAAAEWEELEALLEGWRPPPRQLVFGETAAGEGTVTPATRWELVDVRGVRVERGRDFGTLDLGLALWRRLGLHTRLERLIEPGRGGGAVAGRGRGLDVGPPGRPAQ